MEEKKIFSGFLTDGNLSSTQSCLEKKNEYGRWLDLCKYNSNYINQTHYDHWTLGNYSGNISFTWLYDWYLPDISDWLTKPNSIVTTNAGLNRVWASHEGWESVDALSVAKHQFPLLWDSPVHPTSSLVYRQSTSSCNMDLSPTNQFIAQHSQSHPDLSSDLSPRRHVLHLDLMSRDRTHYSDCNHHPGPPSILTVQFFLNAVCSHLPFREGKAKEEEEEVEGVHAHPQYISEDSASSPIGLAEGWVDRETTLLRLNGSYIQVGFEAYQLVNGSKAKIHLTLDEKAEAINRGETFLPSSASLDLVIPTI